MPNKSHLLASAVMALAMFLGGNELRAQVTQTNVPLRIMSANLNGDTQNYQPFAIRIFQGLKPDIVCIQEFDYISTNGQGTNTTNAMREMVNAAFGTNFFYYREPITANGPIPNGIISRYPFVTNGSWPDAVQTQPNRGFAWGEIALPGNTNIYVVSVHLLTSSAANRNAECVNLKALMQSNFPANALIVLAGDFNPGSRTEACMVTMESFLSDSPIPTDAVTGGNSDTSINRDHPHDYVLPSFNMTNLMVASVFPSHSFSNGLVFDSRVYLPLIDVPPVLTGDSSNAQHMAVIKDFHIPYLVTNVVSNVPAPRIKLKATNIVTWSGVSNFTYTVQGNTNLGTTNWTNLGTATSTTTNLAFTNASPNPKRQFYRVSHP